MRIIYSLLLLTLALFATPSIDELKAAVEKNPALLNSPQAEALMKEKGLSKADIEAKLKSDNLTKNVISEKTIDNKIDILDTDEENMSVNVEKFKENIRLNPFAYKSSESLIKELNKKQQLLTEKKLKRYSERFYANKNMIDSSSLPTPDNYTISTGDVLSILIYGDRNENYELEVRNDGTIEIQYMGPVRVGGKSFKEVKEYLVSKLKQHFKMSSFKISVSKYSSIQVTLIGDVKYPGIYNLSSFATAKDLLIVSKGVRKTASVREIEIKREGKTAAVLDFYDLLFQGKSIGSILLKHGDIVVVKKAKKLVSIDGYVNNAAIFELKGKETLKTLIEYAGGMKADASKRHIRVDRYSQNTIFETFHIPYSKARNFTMRDGDKVYIYKLDESADRSVNIYGNVIRPGSYRIGDALTLHDLLQQELQNGEKAFFLPETYFEYALIKHYSSTLNYKTQSFNLAKVIEGSEKIALSPQDEVYIFSINDIQTSSYVTTKGKTLLQPGKLRYFDGMTIQDAVNASGIDGIIDDEVRVTTINTKNRMPKTIFYSLKKDGNISLHPYDEVEVYDYYKKHLLQPVTIKGEVINPTTVFYEKDMTLGKLLNAAGGTTAEAYLKKVEIVRYFINENDLRTKKVIYLNLNEKKSKNYILEPYDEVSVYKIPNWGEKRVVTLKGEVRFPGDYTISNGEKLSSVIERAGGFTKDAYVYGSVFTRESIRKNQLEQYNRSLAKIKRELAIYNAMPANAKKSMTSSGSLNSLNEVIVEAQKYQPIGRVSIKLTTNLDILKESSYNLTLQDKDTLFVPSTIDTVTVFGEVFNPSSFIYNEELDAEDYIAMASGIARSADSDNIYVIHANGMSEPLETGWFSSSVEIKKGDTIVVPIYIKEDNILDIWDSIAKILASFALTAAAVQSLGVI